MSRELTARQGQVGPVGNHEVRRIIETTGMKLSDLRNLALVLVMRDMLGRRSEVVALDVVDIVYDCDGSARATIGRSNTDYSGNGPELYLLPTTVIHLNHWLVAADIAEGAIFRAVKKGGSIGARLGPNEV